MRLIYWGETSDDWRNRHSKSDVVYELKNKKSPGNVFYIVCGVQSMLTSLVVT